MHLEQCSAHSMLSMTAVMPVVTIHPRERNFYCQQTDWKMGLEVLSDIQRHTTWQVKKTQSLIFSSPTPILREAFDYGRPRMEESNCSYYAENLADLCPFTANLFLMADFFYHLMIKENTYFSKI